MIRLFKSNKELTKDSVTLTEPEYHHLCRVLRIKKNEIIEIVIDEKQLLIAKITHIDSNSISFSHETKKEITKPNRPKITLAQSLPKQDKFSAILRMCTELDIDNFIPIISERVIGEFSDAKINKRMIRWQNILFSACMQSRRSAIPHLQKPLSLESFFSENESNNYDLRLACWEVERKITLKNILARHNSPKNIVLFIGPEGGYSEKEIKLLSESGCQSVSLGETVLKVEHAGFLACANVKYHYSS
jgi:16S rRNA (uracil1498-N3)-methyltransferase